MRKISSYFFIILLVIPLASNSYSVGSFQPPILKLTHDPTVCTFEPPTDPQFPNVGKLLLAKTEYAILDWQTKLNEGTAKHPIWNFTLKKVSLNEQSSFDKSVCDISIYFKRKPVDTGQIFQEAGFTKPDKLNKKAYIEIYYLGVSINTEQKLVGSDSNYNYYETTSTPYFTGYLAADPQIDMTIRHELGHAIGLGHYIVNNDELSAITTGKEDLPSIMVTNIIPYGVLHYSITPNDVNEVRSIYDNKGFGTATHVSSKESTNLELVTKTSIPSTVKNTAKWWAEGSIQDSDFIQGIQYLIQQGIMKIPPTTSNSSSSQHVPVWVKNNAGWWAQGQISDDEFVKGIEYLIQSGIIQISK